MTGPASDDDRDEADEPREDDPMMRSMRSVWLSMREEDPPQGGLAELMAAARAKADVMAPAKEPWWQRLFATLRRPPVLALATVVLLVGGAVIIGKRQTDMKVEQIAPPAPSIEHSANQFEDQTLGGLESAEPIPPVAPNSANAGSSTAALGKDQGQGHAGPTVRPNKIKPPRDSIAKPEKLEVKKQAGGGAPGLGGETDQAIASDEESTKSTTATPSPPPPPPPPPAPVTAPTTDPEVSRPATIAQLVEQSAAAAARGDCATVKTTSARIRKLSPGVYNEQIAKNAAIAKCLK